MTYEVVAEEDMHNSAGVVVNVNEAGQLVSGSRTGQVTLMVIAHEDFGVNQTVVILVKVSYTLFIFGDIYQLALTSVGCLSL